MINESFRDAPWMILSLPVDTFDMTKLQQNNKISVIPFVDINTAHDFPRHKSDTSGCVLGYMNFSYSYFVSNCAHVVGGSF